MLCHGTLYISLLHALGTKDLIHNVFIRHTDKMSWRFFHLMVVTALKYVEIFSLCSTILNYYQSWILCIKDLNWFSPMLLIRVEYFCLNKLKSMNIWLVNILPNHQALFVLDYFEDIFIQENSGLICMI